MTAGARIGYSGRPTRRCHRLAVEPTHLGIAPMSAVFLLPLGHRPGRCSRKRSSPRRSHNGETSLGLRSKQEGILSKLCLQSILCGARRVCFRCQQILNETGDHRGFFIVHKWDDFGARLRHQIVCSRISRLWWINHTRCDGGSIHGFASSPSDGYEVTWIPGAPESHGHPLGDWCTRHRINDIDMPANRRCHSCRSHRIQPLKQLVEGQ